MVGCGVSQKGLCVDSTAEMAVQVSALGHTGEKGAESKRTGRARLFHVGCGLLLRRTGLRLRRKKLQQNGKQQSKLREAGARSLSTFPVAAKCGAILGVAFS
jgi:hypothetical protein